MTEQFHSEFKTDLDIERLPSGAHSGDLDRVFRRIAIRCRESVGRSVTAPSGELADLSIRYSRQAW